MNVPEIIQEELSFLKDDIIVRHEQAGQVASGRTKESLKTYGTSPFNGVLEGASHIGVLERGRSAGKVPYNFKEILQRWAQAKGLIFPSSQDFDRWAYFVAKRIREEGTELYRTGRLHNGGEADVLTKPIEAFRGRLSERLSLFFQAEITNNIFTKQWK